MYRNSKAPEGSYSWKDLPEHCRTGLPLKPTMDYVIKEHRICEVMEDTGEIVDRCEEVAVKTIYTDLLTMQKRVEIVVWADTGPATFSIPREAINRAIIPRLAAYGLTLPDNPDNAEAIEQILFDSESTAEKRFEHKVLGFRVINGAVCFLANCPIGNLSPPLSQSLYCEPSITAPKGSLESWMALMREEVLGHLSLELALSISVSAPIAYMLRESKIFAEIPVWALIGLSSTGKTTALRLMASVFGSPEEGDGLIKDLNATENAFFRGLGDSTGLPLLIDEATCKASWDFASIVYNLSKGKEKARCKNTGELRERISFSGAIVISGENSLFDQSTPALGMRARLVELTLPWTDDAGHARRLSQGVRKNYGTAVYPIVETLLILRDKHPDVLPRLFSVELQRLKELSPKVSGVDERVFNMYATVMVAATIIKNALGLPLSKKDIRVLLLTLHEQGNPDRTVEEKLYDSIMDAVVTHGAYFPKASGKGKNQLLPATIWGEYSTRNMQDVLWITENTFKRFAIEAKCPNYQQFFSKMRDKGLLVDFGDGHYKKKHPLGNGKPVCYCLKLTSSPATQKVPKRTTIKKPSTHLNLLTDYEDINS